MIEASQPVISSRGLLSTLGTDKIQDISADTICTRIHARYKIQDTLYAQGTRYKQQHVGWTVTEVIFNLKIQESVDQSRMTRDTCM